MKKVLAAATAALGIILFSAQGHGAGFRLGEQHSSTLGMASAFTGQADNPAAVWYNPAGITQLEGAQLSTGVIAIFPVLTHENSGVNPGTTDVSDREVHLPVHLYATRRINGKTTFGLGVNNPFGLSTNWDPKTSATRYVATYSQISATQVNPNIAYKLTDGLSAAVGLDYIHLRATLERIQYLELPGPVVLGDHTFRLNGDGDGWGANAAVRYRVSDTVGAGLAYRSRIKVDLEGTASLTGGIAPPVSAGASTSITLPDLILFGLSYKVSDRFTVNADTEYTLWSTFDRIVVESDDPAFRATGEKQWNDTWCFRLGGQYRLAHEWTLRAGYVYDQNPVSETRFSSEIADSDRQGITIGAGYAKGDISIDAGYLYLRFNRRIIQDSLVDDSTITPTALNGTYKSQAHLAGLSIGYKF